jgi:hypothetical protein
VNEDLAFDVDEFLTMPLERRSRVCAQLAEHAQALAASSQLPHRLHYLTIANEWLLLASATEREINTTRRPA